MSWLNPTEEEAEEEYRYYKKKYNSAYNSLNASERNEQNCINIRNSAQKKVDAAKTQKKNDEKRLKEIKDILKILEGSGGWFSSDIPGAIEKNNNAVDAADESYRKCIRCDGITAADIGKIFRVDTVEQNAGSAQALSAFRAEVRRLEQSIDSLKNTIATETARAEDMRTQINRCNSEQRTYRNTMNNALYNMNHYKKYF